MSRHASVPSCGLGKEMSGLPMREPLDIDRIAFVTRRYVELQGMKFVALGSVLILGIGWWTLMPVELRNLGQQILIPANLLVMHNVAIDAFYARAFGRVPSLRRSRSGLQVQAQTIGPVIILFGLMADLLRMLAYPGGPSTAAFALTGYSLWVLGRDGAARVHYVLGVLGGAAAVLSTWGAPFERLPYGRLPAVVEEPYVAAYSITGLTILALGLLDHRVLVQAMT